MTNVYLQLHGRTEFGDRSMEESIIGDYDVKVPIKQFGALIYQEDEIVRSLRKALGNDIRKMELTDEYVTAFCNKDNGDTVNTLEDIYCIKNEIEGKVKAVMKGTEILDYTLIIHVSTLLF